MKPIVWLGDSLVRVRDFPADAKRELGYQLERVQNEREPADWKPMSSVGAGVSEIRARVGGAFRVIYAAKFQEAIYVLHAFQKKSSKTARRDVDLARDRFRVLIRERAER